MNYVTYGTALGIAIPRGESPNNGAGANVAPRAAEDSATDFSDISEVRTPGDRGWFGSGEHRLLDETCQLAQRRGTALVSRGRQQARRLRRVALKGRC